MVHSDRRAFSSSRVAFDGAVDGGACHAEQVGEFGGAVLSGAVQGDQVGFLAGIELWLLPAQTSLGPGDLHALARAQPDQVSLELGDHRQHVEQQPPTGSVGS